MWYSKWSLAQSLSRSPLRLRRNDPWQRAVLGARLFYNCCEKSMKDLLWTCSENEEVPSQQSGSNKEYIPNTSATKMISRIIRHGNEGYFLTWTPYVISFDVHTKFGDSFFFANNTVDIVLEIIQTIFQHKMLNIIIYC